MNYYAAGMLLSVMIGAADLMAATAQPLVVGGRVGFTDIEGMESATTFGGQLDYFITPNVSALGAVDYLTHSEDDVEFSIMSFSGAGKYTFKPVGSPLRPFGLLGLAYHRAKVEYETARGEKSSSASDTSLEFGGGVGYVISRELEATAELRMRQYKTADMTSILIGMTSRL